MADAWDVIVAGLGAMGSATACHLARRGLRVLGLDRYLPPHGEGSSSGRTRIIREAYFEGPAYVPLVQRAYELWEALERDTSGRLLTRTGGLMIGPPEGELVKGALASARQHGLPYEVLAPEEVARRHSPLRLAADEVAVAEPRAGVLFPEACIAAHLAMAVRDGAELRTGAPVTGWGARGDTIEVQTTRGLEQAGALVLAAGAWMPEVLGGLMLPLDVRRQLLHWFEPQAHREAFAPERFPVFIWEHEPGRFFYGFPDFGDGVKLARHGEGESTEPGRVRRDVDPSEADELIEAVSRGIPDACGQLLSSATCMYTNTPDHHFILDAHPAHPRVWVASPCSGHGFKFASSIGELLADLVTGAPNSFDRGPFRIDRFAQ